MKSTHVHELKIFIDVLHPRTMNVILSSETKYEKGHKRVASWIILTSRIKSNTHLSTRVVVDQKILIFIEFLVFTIEHLSWGAILLF
jgi:hypothetical protein